MSPREPAFGSTEDETGGAHDGNATGRARRTRGSCGGSRRASRRRAPTRAPCRSCPVRARGLTIEGADGRRYLDCLSGAGTLALGHNHPVVLEAIRKVLDSGAPLHVLDLATPVKDAFTTELFRTLPPGLADHARVQFCGPGRHGRGRGRVQAGPGRDRPHRHARLHRRLPRHDRRGAGSLRRRLRRTGHPAAVPAGLPLPLRHRRRARRRTRRPLDRVRPRRPQVRACRCPPG